MRGLQRRVIITNIALIVDLDEHMPIAARSNPVNHVVDGAPDGFIVGEPLILAEVEQAQNDGHLQLVRAIQDST